MRSKLLAVLVVLGIVVTACAAPTPEVIKEQVIVEKEVIQTVLDSFFKEEFQTEEHLSPLTDTFDYLVRGYRQQAISILRSHFVGDKAPALDDYMKVYEKVFNKPAYE